MNKLIKKIRGKKEMYWNSTHLDLYIDKFFMINCPPSHSVSEVHEQVFKLLHQILIVRHFRKDPIVLERDMNKAEIKNPNELPKIQNINETTGTRKIVITDYPLRQSPRNVPSLYGKKAGLSEETPQNGQNQPENKQIDPI